MHPLITRLADSSRILIAGAGGGYDVYSGVPLYAALRAAGKEVHLANLTFTHLGDTTARFLAPQLARVDRFTRGAERYFPEHSLCEVLAAAGHEDPIVYCFEKTGAEPLLSAYRHLVAAHRIDAVVLIDGGTDILMRGDEPGLGTPAEDMTSLAAVAGLDEVATRLVACLGFGVDAFHGVQHSYVLEAIADLTRSGGFLGASSLLPTMPEARLFAEAVARAEARFPSGSIVCSSIASAIAGDFGDVQRLARTSGSELFINPLMALYFAFDLIALARRSLYLPRLEGTRTVWDVQSSIEAFRESVAPRAKRPIPL
jgi:hypothetical protein